MLMVLRCVKNLERKLVEIVIVSSSSNRSSSKFGEKAEKGGMRVRGTTLLAAFLLGFEYSNTSQTSI